MASSADLVVGVDGSDGALTAVRWAARAAAARRRGLRLVHATEELPVAYPHTGGNFEELYELVGARGQRLLEAARAAVAEVAPEVKPEVVLRPEQPAEGLLAESATAAMIVLGTSGQSTAARVLLGSASLALAAHAECPVALIRPHVAEDEPPAEGPVIVGVDGTPASEDAIAVAFDEASWRGAPLVAVHAWHDTFLAGLFEEGRRTMDGDAIEQSAHELLDERLAGWQEQYPDVHVERLVQRGRPAQALLDLADRAQLLVVGSRGRSGLAALALGSTSQAVMSYALCPVLVARGGTRPDADTL
ncbi:universal stress protein [Amycolatopsis sp. NPDC088138]|uniref:universal stress protein n=1 Tax=Amycolatopsis sp. NPDC088138 TaxID=3363938 RepID=UPI0037F2374A